MEWIACWLSTPHWCFSTLPLCIPVMADLWVGLRRCYQLLCSSFLQSQPLPLECGTIGQHIAVVVLYLLFLFCLWKTFLSLMKPQLNLLLATLCCIVIRSSRCLKVQVPEEYSKHQFPPGKPFNLGLSFNLLQGTSSSRHPSEIFHFSSRDQWGWGDSDC